MYLSADAVRRAIAAVAGPLRKVRRIGTPYWLLPHHVPKSVQIFLEDLLTNLVETLKDLLPLSAGRPS